MPVEIEKKKALLITTEASPIQEEIKQKILPLGYDIRTHYDIESGWKIFQDQLPQLVILDTYLASGKIDEICSRIESHATRRYVTIVLANNRETGTEADIKQVSGNHHYLQIEVDTPLFQNWVLEIDRRVTDLLDLRLSQSEVTSLQDEIDSLNTQLEQIMERTNQMAMEAELAYLELKQIFKTTAGGIVVIDPDFNILRNNEAFLALSDLEDEEAENKKCYEVFPNQLCHTPDCPLEHIRMGKSRIEVEVEKQDNRGVSVHYLINSMPLYGPDNNLIAIVTNIFDITQRVEAEAGLRESEERFRLVSEKAPFGQAVMNNDHRFEYFNPKFTDVFGYTLKDIPDLSNWMNKAYPDAEYRKEITEMIFGWLCQIPGKRDEEMALTVTCKNGTEKIVNLKEVEIGNGRKIITYEDITEQRKAQEALKESEQKYKELSLLDDLTGLFNKRQLNHQIDAEVKRAARYQHPLSIMLMDIDDFKHYNDTFGHHEGDHVLSAFGKVISESIRETDSAYRYGGEEFVVMMPDTEGKGAFEAAERIRKKFSVCEFTPTPDEKVNKTVSIGIAEYTASDTIESLIERADMSMYNSKKSGKNRVSLA